MRKAATKIVFVHPGKAQLELNAFVLTKVESKQVNIDKFKLLQWVENKYIKHLR